MGNIFVMPPHMADLIAAGEVVERPASVVKELAENAVDAGASSLTVEIKGGGSAYIRLSDNGTGIQKADLPLAFTPHATSKIKNESDLDNINTLGFRGEALASVGAVAKVEVLTLAKGEQDGSCYKIEGGKEISFESAGCPQGTTIIVRDLFYNTPARMKFLKRDVTEGNYVAAVIDKIALSHPELKITFIREGKRVLSTMGDGKLYNTVFSVFGKDFARSLLPVEYRLNGIEVSGFVSKPTECKANRSMQYFFVNSRNVKNVTAMSALENAYKNSVMVGKVPACVLNITLPPQSVDVNVHPAKTEVRFQNDKAVFDAVYFACKNALYEKDAPKQAKFNVNEHLKKEQNVQPSFADAVLESDKSKNANDFFVNLSSEQFKSEFNKPAGKVAHEKAYSYSSGLSSPVSNYNHVKAKIDITVDDDEQELISPEPDAPAKKEEEKAEVDKTSVGADEIFLDFNVIGEAFKTYIIVEKGSDIIFIDKHAAHERIIFEQIKSSAHTDAQQLLTPLNITLSKEDYNAVCENADKLKKVGFTLEDFGSGTVRVRAYPMVLEHSDIGAVIEEMAEYLRENKREFTPENLDWLYHNVACRAAVKGGNYTSDYERERFVKKLFAMPDIRYCPHGRPVMIVMKRSEIEKQFGRTQ